MTDRWIWKNEDYLAIGTLISYENMRNYYGEAHVIPLYIAVDDGVRLERALRRVTAAEKTKLCGAVPEISGR